MKIYVLREGYSGKLRFYDKETDLQHYKLIGETEIVVEPVKKEVVKTVEPDIETRDGYYLAIGVIPKDGYDAVITYKVRE
jgi:hypothetical protein